MQFQAKKISSAQDNSLDRADDISPMTPANGVICSNCCDDEDQKKEGGQQSQYQN
jgi:hypothetical protein